MTKENLVKLADMLDKSGNHKIASKIDALLARLSDDEYVKCMRCGHWYSEHHGHHRRVHCPKCGDNSVEMDFGSERA